MTSLSQTPDNAQLLRRIDSSTVSNRLVEIEDVGAGDSLRSTSAPSERCIAGASIPQMASITTLPTPDSDALATLLRIPGSLRARWQQRYGNWLAVSDVIVVSGVVAAAQILRFGNATRGSVWAGSASVAYSAVSMLIVLAWALVLAIYHTRARRVVGAGPEEFRRVWTATLWVFGVIAIISTLFKLEIARGYLAIAFPLGLLALSVNRHFARVYLAAQRRRGRCLTAVLAVGEPMAATELARSLTRRPSDGYTVVGVCTPGVVHSDNIIVPGLGPVRVFPYDGDMRHAIAASQADTVALASAAGLGTEGIRDLSWQLEKLGVDLVVSPGIVDVAGPRLTVHPVGDLPLIHIDKPQYQGAKRFQKRVFDICFSLLALLVASPVMIVAAVAVKLTSPGPVFYRAQRTGLDSVPFRMVKFRTMVDDADRRLAEVTDLNESVGGVLFKIRSDPRVTPVGRLLRRYSIDELPQFINVLFGEMSVVGPRPPLQTEVETYDHRVRRRLLVRPGITGLWQVSGRSDLSWEDSVRLDLFYVENWSMLSDLAIAAKTIIAVWRSSGAY